MLFLFVLMLLYPTEVLFNEFETGVPSASLLHPEQLLSKFSTSHVNTQDGSFPEVILAMNSSQTGSILSTFCNPYPVFAHTNIKYFFQISHFAAYKFEINSLYSISTVPIYLHEIHQYTFFLKFKYVTHFLLKDSVDLSNLIMNIACIFVTFTTQFLFTFYLNNFFHSQVGAINGKILTILPKVSQQLIISQTWKQPKLSMTDEFMCSIRYTYTKAILQT